MMNHMQERGGGPGEATGHEPAQNQQAASVENAANIEELMAQLTPEQIQYFL